MKLTEKLKAQELRREGRSIKEIARSLGVAQSTVSVWVKDIVLSPEAQSILKTKVTAGQQKNAENRRRHTREAIGIYYSDAYSFLSDISLNKAQSRLLCSLIYWCEGGKSEDCLVQFTNSDPNLMGGFLRLMRKSYPIDETKFRASLHLHEYHDQQAQIDFWSNITGIPKSQFYKPFLKINTTKRIRNNYPGCLQVRYYDAHIARQIIYLGKVFFDNYRSLV